MIKKIKIIVFLFLLTIQLYPQYNRIQYKFENIDGVNIFYRESGSPDKPTIVFLHGTPSSSFMYQQLIYNLSADFHCIAPDYPGYGYSDSPPLSKYEYTFENITITLDKFIKQLGLTKYSFYMQDYGAPFGFRLALLHPQNITALITQNGNAYIEGFPLAQDPKGDLNKFWLNEDSVEKQDFYDYYRNVKEPSSDNWKLSPNDSPDRLLMAIHYMKNEERAHKQFNLWHDYGKNVRMYPLWQKYLREFQPNVLVVWGKEDKFFTTPGSLAYLKDVPKAEVHLLNAGHWASVQEPELIAQIIKSFFITNHLITE
jgi:pimeloyl-ACP methyl ester carboxylesterase